MISINASKARANLFNLINLATEQSEPVLINGKRNSAVLVSESDWRDIQETLYLLSIPGMRESIIEGMNTAIEDCSDSVGW
jgi:prevent-host-death family protein